jgi:hypothetical protein
MEGTPEKFLAPDDPDGLSGRKSQFESGSARPRIEMGILHDIFLFSGKCHWNRNAAQRFTGSFDELRGGPFSESAALLRAPVGHDG